MSSIQLCYSIISLVSESIVQLTAIYAHSNT